MNYNDFLHSKMVLAPQSGFDVDASQINPVLLPHQRDAVQWACKGGCRALFESFGLGKTVQELEWCRLVTEDVGGWALIVLPLGVRQEFSRDAINLLGWATAPRYVRTMAEVNACAEQALPTDIRIMMTNYERVRDGDIDPEWFTATALDEASVLRSFGSKTYQMFLPKFRKVPYKLVSTATPSPNRYKELIHYAGYLGVMDTGQALTRFFQRNSQKANDLNIYPHKEEEFWLWVSTWAMFIQKPSDLGYCDDGYALPPMEIQYHQLIASTGEAPVDRDGQVMLYRDAALGLSDAAREKRISIEMRVAKAREIVESDPQAHFLLWHDLEDERRAIESAFPSNDYEYWQEYKDGNDIGLNLYARHYSAYQYADGRERKLFCGPGEKTVLIKRGDDALFVWRKFIDDSGEKGVNCAVFRNESNVLSSTLIIEAMQIAWTRWPGERLYTYVNPDKIKSVNPGCCFKIAGWKACGKTQGGLIVLEAHPGENEKPLTGSVALSSVYGSLDMDLREDRIIAFSEGEYRLLATKKEISGSGCNFQRHCHRAIFLGIDYEFNDFIQAIHRIYRFLQTEQVIIDIIYMDTEQEILRTLLEKWDNHNKMQEHMAEILRTYGMNTREAEKRMERSIGVNRMEVTGRNYKVVLNDCILETAAMTDDSVDLILTSIPFSNHYEYTPSYNDLGHNEDTDRFFQQMDFLAPNLLRVLKPGRIFACHTKDRVLFGSQTGTGMPSIEPFHALTIQHYMRHGFQYIGMITVVTDVVRENNQTYRLGWTECCKDGSKMGVGCPEYVLLFRKLPSSREKAYADEPVEKSKEEYTRAQWQIDAHAFWRSSGDRLMAKEELLHIPTGKLQGAYLKYSRGTVYNYAEHVALAKELDVNGRLPATFMTVAPGSWATDVWDDILRMRTLNSDQVRNGRQMHVCPLQIDIVDRIINRYTNPGDTAYDPFGGLMTTVVRAIELGRKGIACELNGGYFRDGVGYCEEADSKRGIPTLFDLIETSEGTLQGGDEA